MQTQAGTESTMILSLDSMISCFNTDAEKPDHKYLEKRDDEDEAEAQWSVVHQGKRDWASKGEARTSAKRAILLIYSLESVIEGNDDRLNLKAEDEKRVEMEANGPALVVEAPTDSAFTSELTVRKKSANMKNG